MIRRVRIQRYDVKRAVRPVEALCCPICKDKEMAFHFIVETERIVTLTYTLIQLYIYHSET
jgi:hypothetical protein